jgi:thiol-disulfide isomerase/thioredoxin
MGPRASLVAGIVAGLVLALMAGAIVVAMTGGGAATVTLPPASAPSLPATASAVPSEAAAVSPTAEPTPAPTAPPAGSPSTSDQTGGLFGVGRPAPPLSVEKLGGGTIDLADLKGKPVWVAFTASWCPPCRDEYATMESFALRYADTGLVVLTVHEKDDPAAVQALIDELGVTFPVGLDPDGTAGRDWRAIALPIHFWVDGDGIIRSGALGGVGPVAMAEGLQSILPGVEVTAFATPTPGPSKPAPSGSGGATPLPVVAPPDEATPTPVP